MTRPKKYETKEEAKKARQDYYTEWRRKNQKTVAVTFNVNKGTEMELYSHVSNQPNKNEYIKRLIRKDLYGI